MTYKFEITEEKFQEGKDIIRQNGGNIYTDGSFEISGVEGHFNKTGDIITITITDKPWLASWGTIEDKLNSFFS